MSSQLSHPHQYKSPPPDANRRKRIAPCELLYQQNLELLEAIKREDGEGEYWGAVAKLARGNYYFFLRFIYGYDWMDPWLHGEEICRFIQEDPNGEKLILIPRGHGKSGCITGPLPSWLLARDPLCTTAICNAREDKAAQMATVSANTIKNNIRYQTAFPKVRPGEKWSTQGGYWLNMGLLAKGLSSVDRIDPNLGTYGAMGNITGAHYSGAIIHDDLINAEIAQYPHQMKKVELFFNESLNCLDSGKPLIICGTRWRYYDFYGKLQSGEMTGKRGPVKVLKLGVSRRNDQNEEELLWPSRTYFDQVTQTEKTNGFTWEEVESLRKKPFFSALYYNEPVQDADQKFDVSKVKVYKELPFDHGPVLKIFVETEAQSGPILGTFRDIMRRDGKNYPVEPVKTGRRDKAERIMCVLQPLIGDYQFNIPDHIWRGDGNLGEELRTFDKGFDDLLDACAYVAENASRQGVDFLPHVYVAVDPAFTQNHQSDYTGIVVGCYHDKQFYVLDSFRMQTDRTDDIVRNVLRLVEKWNASSRKGNRGTRRAPQGIRASGTPNRGSRLRGPSRRQFDEFWGQTNWGNGGLIDGLRTGEERQSGRAEDRAENGRDEEWPGGSFGEES